VNDVTPRFAYGADTIELIDSIREGELQTGRHIEEHIADVRYDPAVVHIPITRHLVSTAEEFYTVLSNLTAGAAEENVWPLVHIECHGSDQGLQLAQGAFLTWAEIQPYLMAVNKATRNHLFMIVAACKGFHAIKAMLDRVDDAVSLRPLGGPAEETTSGRIEDGMKRFYAALLRTGDLNAAITGRQTAEATFRMNSAEAVFMAGWQGPWSSFPEPAKAFKKGRNRSSP
jgi:hypothetical protein